MFGRFNEDGFGIAYQKVMYELADLLQTMHSLPDLGRESRIPR